MDPRIKLALQVLGKGAAEDLTVIDLAEEIGLSASRFEHMLKRATGRTFRQHRQSVRVRRAKTLLEDCRLSLKEIAYLSGYASPSSFSRAFRTSVLRSPSEYRASLLDGTSDRLNAAGQV
jgi:AraC family transcriptional regulator, arabinose operon regulatory protein